MPPIKLENAMIAWTANTYAFRNRAGVAPAGSIRVFDGLDHHEAFTLFPFQRGSCDPDWRESDEAYRLELIGELYMHWVMQDGLDPEHVAEAMEAIDGCGLDPRLTAMMIDAVETRYYDSGQGSLALH